MSDSDDSLEPSTAAVDEAVASVLGVEAPKVSDTDESLEGDTSSDFSASDDEEPEVAPDETDPEVWKASYQRERTKWLQATVTIKSLIEQFTEYKEMVDEEKQQLEEQLHELQDAVMEEKQKNNRINQETIANLKTLMMELELIEEKNVELNDELQQERLEHERAMESLTAEQARVEELEGELSETKKQLSAAEKAAKAAGGKTRPTGRPTGRPTKSAAGSQVKGSQINKFSTLRSGGVMTQTMRGVQWDLTGELHALKAQKAELREKLERERKTMIQVMSLVQQLSIVTGTNDGGLGALGLSSVRPSPAASRVGSVIYRGQSAVDARSRARAALAGAAASLATSGERASGTADDDKNDAKQTSSATSAGESAAERIRDAIATIAEADNEPVAGVLSERSGVYQSDDPCFVSQLVGVGGRVTALLQVDSTVWVGCGNGQVDMYAADTHSRLASLRARSSAISQLVDGGTYIWLTATDGGVSIYTRSGALQDTLAAHSAKVTGIACVEKTVWTCGADMTIRVWQNEPPFTCRKEIVLRNMMMSLLYHMGMVWVGTESAIIRWNAQSYRRLDVLNRNGKPLHCVNSLISVEDNVWSLTSDNMIQIWTVQGECIKIVEHRHRMLDIFPCGDQVWITSQAALLVYDAAATPLRNIAKPHSDTSRAVAFVRATEKLSKPHIWSGANDKTVVVWRVPKLSDAAPGEFDAPLNNKRMQRLRKASRKITEPDLSAVARGTMRPTVIRDGHELSEMEMSKLNDSNALDTLDMDVLLSELKNPIVGLKIGNRKSGWRRCKNAFLARELVDWLIENVDVVEKRSAAVELAQRLLDAGHIQNPSNDEQFRDGTRVWQYGAGYQFILPNADDKSSPRIKNSPARTKATPVALTKSMTSTTATASVSSSRQSAGEPLPRSKTAAAAPRSNSGSLASDSVKRIARPGAKAPAPPSASSSDALVSSSSSSSVTASLKRESRSHKSGDSLKREHRSSKRSFDAGRPHDARSASLKVKSTTSALKKGDSGDKTTNKHVRMVSPRSSSGGGTTGRDKRRHTVNLSKTTSMGEADGDESDDHARRRVKRKGKTRTSSSSHKSSDLRRVSSVERRKIKTRQKQTAGSRLSRKTTSGPSTPTGRMLITVQCGEEKVPFEVPRSFTLDQFREKIEEEFGEHSTYSIYVVTPDMETVIGIMTPELNPCETAAQLRREKVDCRWVFRETRPEDYESEASHTVDDDTDANDTNNSNDDGGDGASSDDSDAEADDADVSKSASNSNNDNDDDEEDGSSNDDDKK